MSFSIEYNRRMFTLPSTNGKPSYLLLIKSGDNNCYTREGRRVRDWHLAFLGEEAGFWPYIGERGGYCEGGGLQRAKGWSETEWMSIETYVSIYRKVFRSAKRHPIDDIFSSFDPETRIELRGNKEVPMTLDDVKSPERKEAIERFMNKRSLSFSTVTNYFGDMTSEAYAPVTAAEDLFEAITLRGAVSSSVNGFSGRFDLFFEEKRKGR